MSQIKDTSWVRTSFLSAGKNHSDRSRYQRSKGWMKFMDTTLGGNTAINPPYQFTHYADIKEKRLVQDVGKGMGRWYSQNIDDWGHNVHFRMGIPSYAGVVPFALKAINGSAARYVATGREPGYFSTMGRIAGFVISAAFWEVTLLTAFISSFIDLTHSRFYYLKPTMYQYWRTVQILLNTLSGNLGLTLSNLPSDNQSTRSNQAEAATGGIAGDVDLLRAMREQLPDIFKRPVLNSVTGAGPDVGIDVHAVASRAQNLYNQHQEELTKVLEHYRLENVPPEQIAHHFEQVLLGSAVNRGNKGNLRPAMINPTLSAYEKSFTKHGWYQNGVDEEQAGKTLSEINSLTGDERSAGIRTWFQNTVDSFSEIIDSKSNKKSGLDEILLSEFRDGSQWCSFRVTNSTDSVSESFNNSSEKSDIENIFNNISQSVRGMKFNLADGVTGIKPFDEMVKGVSGAVGDVFVDAAASSVHFLNPVIGLLYGAQIEIPKRWGGSSATLPSSSFKIELRAGYGNVVSYYQDILFPLCMLLAMALPRGTGAQSYGSPFYVQYYGKGRSQVKVGLVSSLSITRGVGNAGWHKRGWPMAVDVNLTIEDMSEIMFSPIASNLEVRGLSSGTMMFNSPIDENTMGDYLAVLSALGMNEQEYFIPRLKRRLNTMITNFDGWISPHRWAGWARDTGVGEFVSAFAQQTGVR